MSSSFSSSSSSSSSSVSPILTPTSSLASSSSFSFPSSSSSSFAATPASPRSVDSLPDDSALSSDVTLTGSEADDDDDDDDDDGGEGETDAEREWKESLQQLELLLTMVLVPYVGKYFGRKVAYWGWAKFMEYNYPVEVVFSSKRSSQIAGAVEAAAAL